MASLRYFVFFVLITSVVCRHPHSGDINVDIISEHADTLSTKEFADKAGNGALLLTRFTSLEDLKAVIQIKYIEAMSFSEGKIPEKPQVHLLYRSERQSVSSILKEGISETDFLRAKNGNFWEKAEIGFHSPYAVLRRGDLMSIESLGRKRPWIFGKGDVAFFNLAEAMVHNISEEDVMLMSSEDLSEKGYLNTFNHITAQAFMTSIFSERLADFVADVHERRRLPELISGGFTIDQLADLENGPVDNYIDIINNELGQELGKILRKKYSITRKTYWTPEILANYVNDIQNYHSWALQIGFTPFKATDEIIVRFAYKINNVVGGV